MNFLEVHVTTLPRMSRVHSRKYNVSIRTLSLTCFINDDINNYSGFKFYLLFHKPLLYVFMERNTQVYLSQIAMN